MSDKAETDVQEPEAIETPAPAAKNPAAVALGRLGGRKGGAARAAKLTPEQRQAIAQLGGLAARGVPRKRKGNKPA